MVGWDIMNLREKGDARTEPFRFLRILRLGRFFGRQKNDKIPKKGKLVNGLPPQVGLFENT